MELDTGLAIPTLPCQKYMETFPDTPLVSTNAILKTYSGEQIKPEGKLLVLVEQNNQVNDLTIYVVKTHGPATPDTARLETNLCYFKRTAYTRHPEEIRETLRRIQ